MNSISLGYQLSKSNPDLAN